MYVVYFENGAGEPYFLAGWEGDPGRTLLVENAEKYPDEVSADEAKKTAIENNPHRYANDFSVAEVLLYSSFTK